VTVDDVALAADAHLVYYRIAQEALRNVTHHAGASAVSVSLTAGPKVTLTITDDGRGFDPGNVPKGHLGLAIMHERAESIGAQLDVESTLGSGTTVRLSHCGPWSRP
jgi:signal transduction histidine kinase